MKEQINQRPILENNDDGAEHGTYIRWLLKTCCARKQENRSLGKKICD